MSDVTVFNITVPEDLFNDVEKICSIYGTDFRTEVVHLLKCYVDSFRHMQKDPVAKIVLKG